MFGTVGVIAKIMPDCPPGRRQKPTVRAWRQDGSKRGNLFGKLVFGTSRMRISTRSCQLCVSK